LALSGDLAKRKVILRCTTWRNTIPRERYAIIGFARTPMTDESFRATIGEAAKTISEVGPIDQPNGMTFLPTFIIRLASMAT